MLKVNTKTRRLSIGILSITTGLCAGNLSLNAFAEDKISEIDTSEEESFVTIQDNNDNTQLDVDVNESLTVTVTTPGSWAEGDAGDFLRNKIGLSVTSNNGAGYTASMYTSETDAKLFNDDDDSYYIPTLSNSQTRGNFPFNYWGYSLSTANSTITTPETDAGNDAAIYAAMTTSTTTPATIRQVNAPGTYNDSIYFGTKANTSQVAGTYSGTVVISVVSGVITSPVDPGNNDPGNSEPSNNTPSNPITPSNPAVSNNDSNTTDNYATYNNVDDRSVYTKTATNPGGSGYATRTTPAGTTTDTTDSTVATTTEVIDGEYTNPLGVTETSSPDASSNSALAIGLAVTAGVAATSSLAFFALARSKKDNGE